MRNNALAIFENFKIRRHYDEKNETWYFSVIDIVAALTEQTDFKKAKSYWTTLKNRLKEEGSELVTKCDQLKLKSADGKLYKTDVATIETLLRLIQTIPSKKAEPIKLWLAKVGYERIQEISDPEKSLNRARENWQKHGRSDKWIQQRMMGQETRNKLTDYWSTHDIKEGKEFAILTNIIHSEWAGLSVKEHKEIKNLKSQNLRDHMTEAELIFTALAELSTRQIADSENANGMEENKAAGKAGGGVAKNARLELEQKTGKKVVSKESYLEPALKIPTTETKAASVAIKKTTDSKDSETDHS
ncbi:MAG: BRO family protein [Patescibacteria group bacterium]